MVYSQDLRQVLNFFDKGTMPEKTAEDPFLQALTDEFYRIKANKEMEVGFMTQAVHDRDMRMEGYEDAEAKYIPIVADKDRQIAENKAQLAENKAQLAENKAQLAENKAQLAEKDDEIAQLKAMLKEALGKLQVNNEE